jgi:hypothetical protein
MAYIENFKKFLKKEEERQEESDLAAKVAGANPSVDEQSVPEPPATPVQPTTPPPPAVQPAGPASVESNPAVITARRTLAQAMAEKDRLIGEKEKELGQLRLTQEQKVNLANSALNKALEDAAKVATNPV